MLLLVFLVGLALSPSTCSVMVPDIRSIIEHARFGDVTTICKWFCDEDNDYFDFFFRSLGKDVDNPRIFCELCKKKTSTTTPVSSSTTPTSTTASSSTSTTSSENPMTTSPRNAASQTSPIITTIAPTTTMKATT